jgi:hypothetical protein
MRRALAHELVHACLTEIPSGGALAGLVSRKGSLKSFPAISSRRSQAISCAS